MLFQILFFLRLFFALIHFASLINCFFTFFIKLRHPFLVSQNQSSGICHTSFYSISLYPSCIPSVFGYISFNLLDISVSSPSRISLLLGSSIFDLFDIYCCSFFCLFCLHLNTAWTSLWYDTHHAPFVALTLKILFPLLLSISIYCWVVLLRIQVYNTVIHGNYIIYICFSIYTHLLQYDLD